MADQDPAGVEHASHANPKPVPVTPSSTTKRPDGVAFDVEEGAELPGVPVGDQAPKNPDAAHTEDVVTERGEGVGLAVPRRPDQVAEETAGENAGDG